MAYREMHVVLVHEVIRRWQLGEPLRAIAAETGVDRKTVRRYVAAAQQHGAAVGGPAPSESLLVQVQAEIRPGGPAERGATWRLCDAHRDAIQGWLKDGARGPKVAELLLRASGVEVPLRTLSRFIQTELRPERRAPTVRLAEHPPGKVLEIDHVELGTVTLAEGPVKLWALVCVAVHSRHAFLWPCRSTRVDELIEGLEAAWAFFGGVFPIVLADNQKAIVTRPDPVRPTLNETFLEYSQARGFLVDLARVRRPQDKPRVERTIGYAWGSCFAGERFRTLEEMRQHAASWATDVAGRRVHGTTQRRPIEAFEAERPLLLPAPLEPYDPPCWHVRKVGADQMVAVAKALYSVPHSVGRREVRLRVDRTMVRIYAGGVLVKAHVRRAAGEAAIDEGDFPAGSRHLLRHDPDALVRVAGEHGPSVKEVARQILDVDQRWCRVRSVHRLLRLCARYGAAEVDAVCEKALGQRVSDVMCIERMLAQPVAPSTAPRETLPAPPSPIARPRFARSAADFHLTGPRRPNVP